VLLTPWPLAVTLALVAIAAIPTRRLFVAGVGSGLLAGYLLVLVALGFLAISGLGPDRLVVPCFVVAFAAPLVASPALVRRAVRRVSRQEKGGPPRDAP
jgi:hypothetical protein